MSRKRNSIVKPTRREVLKFTGAMGAATLAMPYVNRAWAQTVELNMLAWYGHGEPDIVGAYEEANNIKFKPNIMPVAITCWP